MPATPRTYIYSDEEKTTHPIPSGENRDSLRDEYAMFQHKCRVSYFFVAVSPRPLKHQVLIACAKGLQD